MLEVGLVQPEDAERDSERGNSPFGDMIGNGDNGDEISSHLVGDMRSLSIVGENKHEDDSDSQGSNDEDGIDDAVNVYDEAEINLS